MKSLRSIFGKPVLFTLGPGLTMPYSVGILVWNFYETLVIVSTEFLLRFESQIRPTGFAINFLSVTARPERKVRLCMKLFDFFPRRILIRLTWNLLCFVPDSVEILTWSSRKKTTSWEFFRNFVENQGYPLPKLVKFCPIFCNFILGPYCVKKNSQKYFHTLFAPC